MTTNEIVTTEPSENDILEIRKTINIRDKNSILSYATASQRKVNEVSDQMLEKVKTADLGPVGDVLVEMVSSMRGLDFSQVEPGKKQNFFAKLFNKVSPLVNFIQKYEDVAVHINVISTDLERHKLKLMQDVKMLDLLYSTTLEYFHELDAHIKALRAEIEYHDNVVLPELKNAAEASSDPLKAQEYRDLVADRDAAFRKLTDLELTRTVTMQQLPSIRMVQNNDTDLISKINTQILNVIPSWNQRIALAVAAWRSAEATASTKAVSDFSNDLLVGNAELLKQANSAARTEIERGVFDVEAVKKANDLIIETIAETASIARERNKQRAEVTLLMSECNNQLKKALINASEAV